MPSSLGAPRSDPPPTYSFFSASSAADGIRVFFDVTGFLPVSPALSLGTVTAEGFVESTRRTASALLPDPGPVLVAAPGLAAGLVGVPNVPGYPLVARADDPFTPYSEASPILGTGAAVIRADASATRAAALARVTEAGGDDGLAGLAPINELVAALVEGIDLPLAGALVQVSAVEATAEETQPSPTQLIATSTAHLSGLSLLGGLVRIASIETTARVRLDGVTATAEPPQVAVSGVTVAGVPAKIGEPRPEPRRQRLAARRPPGPAHRSAPGAGARRAAGTVGGALVRHHRPSARRGSGRRGHQRVPGLPGGAPRDAGRRPGRRAGHGPRRH